MKIIRNCEGEAILKILLAEDDRNFGIVIKSELEEERYTVDLVHDGVEAVLFFIDNPYDFVLIDFRMPKLDGISVLRIIKKIKPIVPAIVFSGNAGYAETEELLRAGAIKFFTKPFEMAELKQYIRGHFRGSHGESSFSPVG